MSVYFIRTLWERFTYGTLAKTIMINNPGVEVTDGMTQCTRCGGQLNYNDETTKLVEYACPTCHNTVIVQKESFRARA